MGQALEVAENDRSAIFLRQAVDLLVDDRGAVIAVDRGGVRRCRPHRRDGPGRFDGPTVADPSTDRGNPGPRGDPDRDSVKPAPDRILLADRPGPARQDQERRLERVVHVGGIVQDATADAQDHRPVPLDQDLKRLLAPLVPTHPEPFDQLSVGQPRAGPRAEEDLEMVAQRL